MTITTTTAWCILFLVVIVVVLLIVMRRASPRGAAYGSSPIAGGDDSLSPGFPPRARPAESPGLRTVITAKDLRRYPRSRSESRVVECLEHLTESKFPTVYISWLVQNGHQLELDGYNDPLKIAVEFSGPQHTKWYPKNESYDEYTARVDRDKFKLRQCEAHGVSLIVIDMTLPAHQTAPYFLSRLYDIGQRRGLAGVKPFPVAVPSNYIPVIAAKVWLRDK